MKALIFIWAVLALIFLVPSAASASSYCVEAVNMKPMCIYDDVRQCKRDALNYSGTCTFNREMMKEVLGSEQFCLIDSGGSAQCIYSDISACDNDARKNNSICTNSALLSKNANPYRYDLNRIN